MADTTPPGWTPGTGGGGYPPAGPPGPPAPGYPPPGYPPPGYGVPAARTSGLAVASLIMGIASLIACPLIGVGGLVTGFMAKRRIRESNGAETGDGLATGGIVTSLLGLLVVGVVVGLLVLITVLGTSASSKFSSVGRAIS